MSVPSFYLLLALAAVLPANLSPAIRYLLIIVILSFVGWAGLARVIRGISLSTRNREYVEAARALGVSDLKIIPAPYIAERLYLRNRGGPPCPYPVTSWVRRG